MANVWAIKSGDWSDTTVWNTGALPTSADDVYANNFIININQSVSVKSIRNTSKTGITAGGRYVCNTNNITIDLTDTFYMHTAKFMDITATSGLITINILTSSITFPTNPGVSNAITYSGNTNLTINTLRIYCGPATGPYYGIEKTTSTGTFIINADIYQISGGWNSDSKVIKYSSNSNNVINGNIYGTSGGTLYSSGCISISAGSLTVNGNIVGNNSPLGSCLLVFGEAVVFIIGNISGVNGDVLSMNAGECTVTGTITGSKTNGSSPVKISGGIFNHVGAVQASAFSSGIVCNSALAQVTCTGPFLKNGYIVAIASQTLRINFNSNSYFQFKKSDGDDIDYVSTIEGYNYPTPADVRYGVEYKSGLAIGTCHVPTPDNVRKNIPVDNTVGTSDNVNAEDILEAIQNSTLPIAERLRNVATVESTGAQITSYG